MHMISREAAGLKPEAVVSYFQEKERGRKVRLGFFFFFGEGST